MHSVLKSATSPRGDRRAAIITCAQQLAVKSGYSGFTFDDLAQAVGVSRRTLFNHVSSKEEAVLGVLPEVTDEQIETLSSGGPTGHLVDDLVLTILDSLNAGGESIDDWQRLHDVVLRNPELLARIQSFVDDLSDHLVSHLARRTDADHESAWMALTIAGGVVGRSVRECIDDPTLGPLRSRVEHNLDLTRELLADRR